jgi:hypothetical protein
MESDLNQIKWPPVTPNLILAIPTPERQVYPRSRVTRQIAKNQCRRFLVSVSEHAQHHFLGSTDRKTDLISKHGNSFDGDDLCTVNFDSLGMGARSIQGFRTANREGKGVKEKEESVLWSEAVIRLHSGRVPAHHP